MPSGEAGLAQDCHAQRGRIKTRPPHADHGPFIPLGRPDGFDGLPCSISVLISESGQTCASTVLPDDHGATRPRSKRGCIQVVLYRGTAMCHHMGR